MGKIHLNADESSIIFNYVADACAKMAALVLWRVRAVRSAIEPMVGE